MSQQQNRVIFGALADRSVPAHAAREQAIQLALEQMNQAGGVSGREFGVVFCSIEENPEIDNLNRQEAAVGSALYLADLGVSALIGPMSSNDTEKVFTALRAEQRDVVVMSPSATSPTLTSLEMPPSDQAPGLLWRTAPPDSLQGRAIAFDLQERALTDVAVIYEEGAYGTALAQVLDAAYQQNMTLYPYDGPSEYAQHVVTAAAGTAQEIIFISSQVADVIGFLQGAVQETLIADGTKTLFLTDAAATSEVLGIGSPLVPNLRGSRPAPADVADPVFSTFKVAYSARFEADPSAYSYVANAYDAAWLLGLASARAVLEGQPLSGTPIARGLRRLSAGVAVAPGTNGWNSGLAAMASGENINYRGASGALNYNAVNEETASNIELWTVNVDNPAAPRVAKDYHWNEGRL